MRFEVGFPANGRTINAPELEKILFDFLPPLVVQSFYYRNWKKETLQDVYELSVDQHFVREELPKRNLVAFCANGMGSCGKMYWNLRQQRHAIIKVTLKSGGTLRG